MTMRSLFRGFQSDHVREDRLAVSPSDPPGLQKSKRRASFLLAMMDELTDRNLSPEKAIDVAMIWLKSPTALEDMEQWGKAPGDVVG